MSLFGQTQQQPAAAPFSFGQPQQQQQNQQHQAAPQPGLFGAAPATPGPLSVNDLSRQPQHQQQPQNGSGFSFAPQSQQHPAQQPQYQQQLAAQAGAIGAQHSGPLFGSRSSVGPSHPGLAHSASSGSLYGASQGAAQQGSVYVPGYLSKIRSNKPYASNRRVSGHHSPTNEEDGNTSRDVDGRGGPTSPTHAFQSSFFSSRSPTTDDRATARSESIFGPGGLRGSRRSVGPGGSVAGGVSSWGDDASMRGSVGPGGLRRSASGAFGSGGREASAMAMDDDEDMPPVQGLREGPIAGDSIGFGAASAAQAVAGLDSSLYASRLGMSTASRASTAGALAASTGLGTASAVNGIASSANSSADPTCTLLIFGFPVTSKNVVLRFFETIGEIVAMTPVSSLSETSASGNGVPNGGAEASQLGSIRYDALQITYAQQWCALRALRRNGDLVPGTGCRVGIRFSNENLHREVVQNGINSAVLTTANAAVLANGGDIGELPGRTINAGAGTNAPTNSLTETANGNTALTAQARRNRESTPAFGRPISMVDTPSLVLRTPGSGGSGSSSANASPFTKAANIFGAATGGASRSGIGTSPHPSPAHRHGRHSSALPPSSLFRSALSNSPAPAQGPGGASAGQTNVAAQKADGNQAAPGNGLGQRISDAIFGW